MFQRIKFSFAARLNFYLITSFILLFSIGAAIFYHYSFRYIENNTFEKIDPITEKTNLKVTQLLRTIEKIPENLSWMLPVYVTQPDSIFNITRQVVKNNYEIFGCSIAFEPYYFPQKGAYFAPYSYMQGDSVVTTEIEQPYNYYHKRWYQISKEQNTARWSRPYHELSDPAIITSTYSVPLRNSAQEIIGIFSVDLSLNWLTELLDTIKPFSNSYYFIVNAEGKYILHSQNEVHLPLEKTLFEISQEIDDPSAFAIAQRIVAGQTGCETFHNKGKQYYIFYAPIQGTEWYMATICPYAQIYQGLHKFNLILLLSVVFLLLLICLIISATTQKITKPLKIFAASTQAIAKGEFNTPLPAIRSGDEMQELHQAFRDMQYNLAQYVSHLEKTTQAKEKIESELRIAHNIQMSMLPKEFPPFPGRKEIDLYATLFPARQVGGDFYDFFIRDEKLYFAIGDVSGKGVPASLLMASTVSLLRSFASHYNSPAQITRLLNNSIAERNETGMFVTFFMGVLNLKSGNLIYCNAGHTPPVLTSPHGEISFFHLPADLPLGILKDHDYQEYPCQFYEGSGILLYTDGVTDAENPGKEFYSSERLLQTVRQNQKLHPQEFIGKILEDIQRHTQTQEQSDDISMLTIIYGTQWNNTGS